MHFCTIYGRISAYTQNQIHEEITRASKTTHSIIHYYYISIPIIFMCVLWLRLGQFSSICNPMRIHINSIKSGHWSPMRHQCLIWISKQQSVKCKKSMAFSSAKLEYYFTLRIYFTVAHTMCWLLTCTAIWIARRFSVDWFLSLVFPCSFQCVLCVCMCVQTEMQ